MQMYCKNNIEIELAWAVIIFIGVVFRFFGGDGEYIYVFCSIDCNGSHLMVQNVAYIVYAVVFSNSNKKHNKTKKSETFYVFGRNKCSTTISMSAIHKAFFPFCFVNIESWNCTNNILAMKMVHRKEIYVNQSEKKANPSHSFTFAKLKHLPLNFDVPHDKKNTFASVKKIWRYTEQNVLKIQKKNLRFA